MASTQQFKADEFLIVRHSVLNGNSYDVGELVDDTLKLSGHINGKTLIPCFEGDLLQVSETDEIVLTHQNFIPLSRPRFQRLHERGLAVSLKEALDRISGYRQSNPESRLVLCLELKPITHPATIDKTIKALKEYRMNQDIFFDSFYGGKIDLVKSYNRTHDTGFPTSLHLIGNLWNTRLMMTPPKEHDIVTVPYSMSIGRLDGQVIYGAVGSSQLLEQLADRPNTLGVYYRAKEGAGVKGALIKLWNSVTNTESLRKVHISKYSLPGNGPEMCPANH